MSAFFDPRGRGMLHLPRMLMKRINPKTGRVYTEAEATKVVEDMAKMMKKMRSIIDAAEAK